MSFPGEIAQQHRDSLAQILLQLRGNLANGRFLRKHFYTVDESRLAGNSHHYWLRLGLTAEPLLVIESLLSKLPRSIANWFSCELNRTILSRLPPEYSTLLKIPFSVSIAELPDRRETRIVQTIDRRLPAVMPYAIFHLEINRLLRLIGAKTVPANDAEFDMLAEHHCRSAIAKARVRFPEVWDELRGHYVLDSRGFLFAKRLVAGLKSRNLISANSKFVDVGSGIGTNLIAFNHYSKAHATGVEQHAGLTKISSTINRRLGRLGQFDSNRVKLVCGDAFDPQLIDLGRFDVFYVYSPLGKWEIDIDDVVDRAKSGAVIVFNRLPIRTLDSVDPIERIAGQYAFRKR